MLIWGVLDCISIIMVTVSELTKTVGTETKREGIVKKDKKET